jgi:hypothetical protein
MIGWLYWTDKPPPPDEIVECKRVIYDFGLRGEAQSFWVKPSLVSPAWNVADVIWRPVTDDLRKQIAQLEMLLALQRGKEI